MADDSVECLFCTGPVARGKRGEDMVPKWYAKALGHPTLGRATVGRIRPTGAHMRLSRRTQTIAAREFRLPNVCTECNTQWMSKLESHAKRVALGMTRGQAVNLDLRHRRLLAAWAQLKAICWNALGPKDWTIPPAEKAVFMNVQPLPGWSVVAAHVRPDSPIDVTFMSASGQLGGLPQVAAFRVLIHLGELALIVGGVISGGSRSLLAAALGSGPEEILIRIWPPVRSIDPEHRPLVWPPIERISHANFVYLLTGSQARR